MRPRFIILATIALNAALFAANLSVALVSGSRTVLSQAIYTLTDLVGGLFLLWGLYVSRRPPDHEHPFGFGKERFFWAFVSTVVTFTAAGIVALVEGIDQLVAPIPVTHLGEGVFVVGATLTASVVGIWVTLRELRIARQTLQTLLESSNQGLKSIFYQDLVTIYGSVIAFAGLLIVYRTSDYWVDGAVAAFEGLLLVVTGLVLTAESREDPDRAGPGSRGRSGDARARGAGRARHPRALPAVDAARPRRRAPRPPDKLPGRADDRSAGVRDRPGDAHPQGGLSDPTTRDHRTGIVARRASIHRTTVRAARTAVMAPKNT